MLNGASTYSNGNTFCDAERKARTLPWLFRASVPGYQYGWPV